MKSSVIDNKIVHDKIEELTYLSLDSLVELQGDLKSLDKVSYKKFKNQLLENGFTSPFHVWIDDSGKHKILDGHQRLKTLKMMDADGYQIPRELPCVIIQAKDEKQARKILLGLAAVYGKMSDESLSDYLTISEITLDWVEHNIELPFNSGLDVDMVNDEEKTINGDVELSPELQEENNYIILLYSKKDKFEEAYTKFGLKSVQSNLARNGNPNMVSIGIGRCLIADDLNIEIIK